MNHSLRHPALDAPKRPALTTVERRRTWLIAALTALWFGIPMAIVALNDTESVADASAWYASIAAGIVIFGLAAGIWSRVTWFAGDVWKITAITTAACAVGFYIPFASSHACAAISDPGGCASSGAAAVIAGFAPLYGAFLGPVALGISLRRRRAARLESLPTA